MPFESLTIVPFINPFFLIKLVNSLVSMPYNPITPFFSSHLLRVISDLQLEGLLTIDLKIAPLINGLFEPSLSSLFKPTLPICGNVNVIICEQ